MREPYEIDKFLTARLALQNEDTENIVAREGFWMVIRAYELKLENYDYPNLDKLSLLRIFLESIPQFGFTHKINVNTVFIRLIDKQIKKLG